MASRILPNDKPSRAVRSRQATIYSRPQDGNNLYYVTVGGLPEPAEYDGTTILGVGQRVIVSARPEMNRWWIHL